MNTLKLYQSVCKPLTQENPKPQENGYPALYLAGYDQDDAIQFILCISDLPSNGLQLILGILYGMIDYRYTRDYTQSGDDYTYCDKDGNNYSYWLTVDRLYTGILEDSTLVAVVTKNKIELFTAEMNTFTKQFFNLTVEPPSHTVRIRINNGTHLMKMTSEDRQVTLSCDPSCCSYPLTLIVPVENFCNLMND